MSRTIKAIPALAALVALLAALPGCGGSDATSTPPIETADPVEVDAGPPRATIRVPGGEFTIEFRPEAAPVSCANFINLVRRGFYDGQAFYRHSRVIRQAGNPWGESGRWDPGYRISPEFSPDLRFDRAGMVALVREADDVRAPVRPNEFFVTTKPQSERFTFFYPVFAEVVEGQQVVDAIRPDEEIVAIELSGDVDSILESQASLVEEWNRRLDAAPPLAR